MKKEPLYTIIIGISLAGYAWLAWNLLHVHDRQPAVTICMVKTVTGLPCPSCGTTRSLTNLLEGNITGSLLINPLGVIALILMVVLPLWITVDYFRKKDSFFHYYTSAESFLTQRRWAFAVFAILVAANWWWNIEKGL